MVCVTLGSEPAGPSGSGILASAVFVPVNTGTSQIGITRAILTDPLARVISTVAQGGSVTVGLAPTPTITPLPTNTHTPGPSPTPTETPTPGPSPTPIPTATFVPGTTAVTIDPASQDVLVGGYFTVDVMVANVNHLGAYEFTLQFDPDTINYVTVSNGPFLGSSGRSLYCPDPITDAGILRFGCVTSGSSPPGASGSGQLAQVVFQAAAPGASPLTLVEVALADPLGETIDAAVASGSVNVMPTGATASGMDIRTGFLTAVAVLIGAFGLLLRPPTDSREGWNLSGVRRGKRLENGMLWVRCRTADFMRSLLRRIAS